MCGIGSLCLTACNCCTTACCGCLNCAKCGTQSKQTRVPYLMIMGLGVALALILFYWGKPLLVHLVVTTISVCTDHCMSSAAVYRISFVLFVFFAVHAFFLIWPAGLVLHRSFWLFKILSLFTFLVICFIIPSTFFTVYADIARFVSGFFLLLQIVILIDFAYSWNESWASDEKGNGYRVGIIVCSLLLFAGSITLCVFCFRWFTHGSCERNTFFIGFTICLVAIMTIISVGPCLKEGGGLLPAAVMSMYAFWLLYSALRADPSACNTFEGQNDPANLVIGIVVAVVSVTYAAWDLTNAKNVFYVESDDDAVEIEAPTTASGDDKDAAAGDDKKGKSDAAIAGASSGSSNDIAEPNLSPEEEEDLRKKNLKFHLVMCLTAMYFAMVLTNFASHNSNNSKDYSLGTETVYVKIVSQWVALLLFIWSLVAPLVCTGRDFS